MRVNESERFVSGFIYEGHLRNFLYRDIHKKLGMSFDEYINRPRYEIDLLNKVVGDIDSLKAKSNQNLLDELERNKQQGKKET